MTCIVGLETPDGVWIGGDSFCGDHFNGEICQTPKVFHNGPYLIGYSTSFRMGQLLRYADLPVPPENVPTDDFDAERWMATTFVTAIREHFKNGGFATRINEREEGGTFLVGFAGRLFAVIDEYAVMRIAARYTSCGSGWLAASGALYATPDAKPVTRVQRALEAAQAFTTTVRGPFLIEFQPNARGVA